MCVCVCVCLHLCAGVRRNVCNNCPWLYCMCTSYLPAVVVFQDKYEYVGYIDENPQILAKGVVCCSKKKAPLLQQQYNLTLAHT